MFNPVQQIDISKLQFIGSGKNYLPKVPVPKKCKK